ncbi:MAG: phosphomannomutase/phosphoglucomutase [Phototrophicales bacterium]|nr:phosphomannomutase/phosphoglucomutase [Phototrophicales bacterium]
MISSKLFKKYDIRGVAIGEYAILTTEAAQLIGAGFGTFIQRYEHEGIVVVGYDNRLTSLDLAEAFINGLRESGCTVIVLGQTATPVVYWHAVNLDSVAGVMVTGSHLGGDQNGFKFCIGNRAIYGDDLQAIRQIIENNDFITGTTGGMSFHHDAQQKYIESLQRRVLSSQRQLRVVVDAGNGMGGVLGTALIRAWGHNVIEELFCEPDGNYPNHPANPQEAENMVLLGQTVRKMGADIGIAFDGDCDRMGAVDEDGNMITADRLLALLARDMLTRQKGAGVVGEVLCSQVLFDVIAQSGGVPYMAASGHALVKEAMKRHHALLGGEMSGHIFFGEDYFGFDDGFLAAGRLLAFIANSPLSLGDWNAELPMLYSTPEYRPHCPDEWKQVVIDGVAGMLKDKGRVETIDGFRIQFEHGWGILRASNTEPVLSLRFEGQTRDDALAYKQLFMDALAHFPQVEKGD